MNLKFICWVETPDTVVKTLAFASSRISIHHNDLQFFVFGCVFFMETEIGCIHQSLKSKNTSTSDLSNVNGLRLRTKVHSELVNRFRPP
jgi:hypothetical protein